MMAIFYRGGPLMWPLLICSLLSVTIIIERVVFWIREGKRQNGGEVDRVLNMTEKGMIEEAVSMTESSKDPAVKVMGEGLKQKNGGAVESVEMAAVAEIERMKRGMNVLDTVITLAPLLGILGTVLGIIDSFDMLGKTGIENPRAVTGGIAQALITTAAGLSVAIVALIPFNIFVTRVQRMVTRLEKVSTRFEIAYREALRGVDEA